MFRLLFLSLLPFVSGEYISGHRLDALNLQTFKDIGARSCCKECAAHGGCHSVNYNVQTFSCELTYHVAELKAKTANADYIYMDKSYCDSLVASCSNFCNLTCTTNQKCVLLNTNQPMCIATGCDHPSSIPGITPRDVGMNIGSVYWFDCTTPTPSKQKFTCDASGQWIPTFSECQCWYGHYSSGSSCKPCPAGTYLPNYGKKGSGSCIQSPAGSYSSSAGSKSSTPCSAGYYQNHGGQSNCHACPPGQFSNGKGARSCGSCPEGTSNGNSGQTACSKCQPGTFSGRGASSCQSCPPGSFNNIEASSNCTLCPIFQYQDGHGSTTCKDCTTALIKGQIFCILTVPEIQSD